MSERIYGLTPLTAPSLSVTSPAVMGGAATVQIPMIQLAGFSTEPLQGLTFDVSNAFETVTNQGGDITGQFYDTNIWAFTTNWFQCLDIALTNGLNVVTLHATDLAGNETTTNFVFTLDYTGKPAPTVQLYWPQNGTEICGSTFSWRGIISDPTATAVAQTVDSSGDTNTFNVVVERDGKFWAAGLPLSEGSNLLTLSVTDAVGNVVVTNIVVYQSSLQLTIELPNDLWNTTTIYGTIGDQNDYTVWVNGMKAFYIDENGDWEATNVPLVSGGVELFQARAIPNSNNGGNGTGGSNGSPVTDENLGNPDPAVDTDVEAESDRPARIYIKNYTQSYSLGSDWSGTGSGPEGSQSLGQIANSDYSITWDDQNGGSGFGSDFDQHTVNPPNPGDYGDNSVSSDDYVYNWPVTGDGVEVDDWEYEDSDNPQYDGSGTDTTPYSQTPVAEHCDVTGTVVANAPGGVDLWGATWQDSATCFFGRSADAQMELDTGGKSVAGQQSLVEISASAMWGVLSADGPLAYINPWSLPANETVDPTQIKIMGKNLDANGNAYFVLPKGASFDVTPVVAGKSYYTWTFWPPAIYTPTIVANNVNISTNTPTFCVGQQVNFSVAWLDSGDPGAVSTLCHWHLPGTFVNEQYPYSDTCTSYRENPDLLTNYPSTQCWYVNQPGGQCSVGLSLQFSGGESVPIAAVGSFSIVAPTIVNMTNSCSGVNMFTNSDGSLSEIALMGTNGEGMTISVFVKRPNNFSGTASITQLINRQLNWNVPVDIPFSNSTGGNFWLDTESPYSSRGIPLTENGHPTHPVRQVVLADAPGLGAPPLGFYNYAEAKDDFNDYVQFQPDGGIPITIGLVDWGWHARAINTGSWMLVTGTYYGPTLTTDDAFPVWPITYTGSSN